MHRPNESPHAVSIDFTVGRVYLRIVAITASDSEKTLLLFAQDLALLLLKIWYKKQYEDVDIDWRGAPQEPGQTSDA